MTESNCHPLITKQVFYHLTNRANTYYLCGGNEWIRATDLLRMKELHYRCATLPLVRKERLELSILSAVASKTTVYTIPPLAHYIVERTVMILRATCAHYIWALRLPLASVITSIYWTT